MNDPQQVRTDINVVNESYEVLVAYTGCPKIIFAETVKYSRTELIRINWDGKPSGYAENTDNWIFLWKYSKFAVWSSAVTIYSMYLRLDLSTMPDLKF